MGITEYVVKDKRAWEYGLMALGVMLLNEWTMWGIVNPLWLSLTVSLPTFGYLYLKSAQIADVALYVHVMHRFFKWSARKYFYDSWLGLLFVPSLTIFGYSVGVSLCVQYPVIRLVVTMFVIGSLLIKARQAWRTR